MSVLHIFYKKVGQKGLRVIKIALPLRSRSDSRAALKSRKCSLKVRIGTIRQATARAVEMSKIKVSEDSVLRVMQEAEDSKKLLYSEEFDPGSGLTLAAGLTHASHGRIFGSNIGDTTGARVSNAYVTNRSERDNPEKFGLIPRKARERHLFCAKGAICRTTDMRIISLLAG